jgi:hypothetical protein
MSAPAITMDTALKMIVDLYHADEPLFLMGMPGMGKTALYESAAAQLKIGYIDFRFTMRDPVDIGGMRVPNLKTGKMEHFAPEDLPIDARVHGPKGLLVCDEINSVGPMMQAAGYGIIQERRSGMKELLPGWCPMASGNEVGDRASAQRLSTATANRFNVQRVKPDVNVWRKMFGDAHCDARGCAVLAFRPDLFQVMPTADQTAFPSARSWTKAFKMIDKEPAYRRQLFTGWVGEAAAGEFEAFWRIMESAVTLDQITADPDKTPVPDHTNPGLCYAVAGMLGKAINRKNFDRLAVYINRLIPSYQVLIMQSAVKREATLANTSAYGGWCARNQALLS